MTAQRSTRRAILAGAAAIPVSAIAVASLAPSTAIAAPTLLASDDPIFAAIERCRAAEALFDADPEGPGVGLRPARQALARTAATTPAGLAALTGFLREQSNRYDAFYFDCESDEPRAFGLALDESVRGMTGLAPWSPGADAAERPDDPIFAVIERHRKAVAALSATPENAPASVAGKLMDAERDATLVLMRTEPATRDGVLVMLHHLSNVTGPSGIDVDTYAEHFPGLFATIERAVRCRA